MSKVYVNVLAEFTTDGSVYEIQRISDIRRAASLKAGGAGTRYTCIVNGFESHLFYEGESKWFLEEKTGS